MVFVSVPLILELFQLPFPSSPHCFSSKADCPGRDAAPRWHLAVPSIPGRVTPRGSGSPLG